MNEDHNFGLSVRVVRAILSDSILSEGVSTGIPMRVILLVSSTSSLTVYNIQSLFTIYNHRENTDLLTENDTVHQNPTLSYNNNSLRNL